MENIILLYLYISIYVYVPILINSSYPSQTYEKMAEFWFSLILSSIEYIGTNKKIKKRYKHIQKV